MAKDKDKAGPIAVLIAVALVPLTVYYYAWATVLLWTWHLADRFGPLSLRQAVGLDLVVSVITAKIAYDGERTGEEHLRAFGKWLILPLMALLTSIILRQFI